MMPQYAVKSCWDGKGCGKAGKTNHDMVVPWEKCWCGGGFGIRGTGNKTGPNTLENVNWLS